MDEKELVKACQRGDLGRFGELYDLHFEKIYRFVYYKTHHRETAEDLTSQVFMKAIRAIGQADPERKFSSWLYGIAQNAVFDHYRSVRPGMAIDDTWDISSDDDIPRDVDVKMRLEEVKKHLAKLPSIQRDIVMMRVWEEMPYKEIAEAVGKSEDSCKMIMSRAIKELKRVMPLTLFLLFLIGQKNI